MRLAAAIQWYTQGRISQDKPAEIARVNRAAFIAALSQAGVSPFQLSAETLWEDLADAS